MPHGWVVSLIPTRFSVVFIFVGASLLSLSNPRTSFADSLAYSFPLAETVELATPLQAGDGDSTVITSSNLEQFRPLIPPELQQYLSTSQFALRVAAHLQYTWTPEVPVSPTEQIPPPISDGIPYPDLSRFEEPANRGERILWNMAARVWKLGMVRQDLSFAGIGATMRGFRVELCSSGCIRPFSRSRRTLHNFSGSDS